MRVLVDTNVLVSAFASRGFCADLFELVLLEHELIVGSNVLRDQWEAAVIQESPAQPPLAASTASPSFAQPECR